MFEAMTWLEALISMKMVLVGNARLVTTTIFPFFSTMNSRLVSPGGDAMQTGLVNAREGNAFCVTNAPGALDSVNVNAMPKRPVHLNQVITRLLCFPTPCVSSTRTYPNIHSGLRLFDAPLLPPD